MPSMDRHWRAMYVMVIAFGIGIAILVLSPHLSDYFSGTLFPIRLSTIKWSDLWGALTFLSIFWSVSWYVRGARRRERQRQLALGDEADAMLLARVPPLLATSMLPDLAHEPLQLLWRTHRGPQGVLATNDGLISRRPRKRDILIRWGNARLFEVWFYALGSDNGAGYALRDGKGNIVEWQDHREGKAPPAEDGASFAEMQRRQQALLSVIIARTGLQMRTFVLDLAQLPTEAPSAPLERRPGLSRVWHWGTVFLLVLAGGPLLVAIGALTLPLTRSFLVNVYVAATTGALGLFLFGLDMWIVAGVLRDRPPSPPPFVALPPVPEDWRALATPLRLREARMPGQRIICLMVALLLAGDGYALIRSLIDNPSVNGDNVFGPVALRQIVIGALFAIVVFGIMVCGIGLFERRLVVIADRDGVRWRRGRRGGMLTWQLMTRLVASFSNGKLKSFGVAGGDANATEIGWPANGRWDPRPAAAATNDSDAAELAALVAQRTGLALTVEDEK